MSCQGNDEKSDTVILDEPFSGMDEETKILAAEYIKSIVTAEYV